MIQYEKQPEQEGNRRYMMDEMLQFNRRFVENKDYIQYKSSKYPNKKVAIITCMDTRLTHLLPAALGLRNGDAQIIKSAGAIVAHPFGSAMRSLLIGIYDIGIREIMVIGHTDCGARRTDSRKMIEKMKKHGIQQESIDSLAYFGVNFDTWLGGFVDLDMSVRKSVELIRKHPLVPEEIKVHGLIIDSVTGELSRVD